MIHHCDEQVQQHHDVNHRVTAEHQHAPETRENLYAVEFEAVEVDEAKYCPEESLSCLP